MTSDVTRRSFIATTIFAGLGFSSAKLLASKPAKLPAPGLGDDAVGGVYRMTGGTQMWTLSIPGFRSPPIQGESVEVYLAPVFEGQIERHMANMMFLGSAIITDGGYTGPVIACGAMHLHGEWAAVIVNNTNSEFRSPPQLVIQSHPLKIL